MANRMVTYLTTSRDLSAESRRLRPTSAFLVTYVSSSTRCVLQDIIGSDEIKLDFFFKASLINDLVNVSVEV